MLKPAVIVISFALVCPASAAVRVDKDAKGEFIKVSGLDGDHTGCVPFKLIGKIVKREFDKDVITVSGITLEESNGRRSFINVSPPAKEMDAASLGNLTGGLQLLSREGRKASISGYACGAAGRVLDLDSIK